VRIKRWRTWRKWTQRELASNVPGLDASTISKIEAGTRGCSAGEAELLARALGLEMGVFYSEIPR